MKNLLLLFIALPWLISASAQSVTDIDGNTYPTAKIGIQSWMAKNLASTKSPDGSSIISYPYFGSEDSVKQYGRMYDWHNALKACPEGWHLPSDEEWMALVDYLGGPMIAGGKIKETGTSHWKSPNKGATNESGFTALPSGYRTERGKYINFKQNLAYYWSSTSYDDLNAWGYYITYGEPIIYRYSMSFTKKMGFAVRCVKD
jgi:uncharacterized protein (TIGR02145 family)